MGLQLVSTIKEVLKIWNDEVKKSGIDAIYELDVKVRKKKFYLDKDNFYEHKIAEMLFFYKGDKTYLLWRKQLRMPTKVAKTAVHTIENAMIDDLYKYFLYEAIGIFGLQAKQSIIDQDSAEYDIEKDRFKAHDNFKNTVIEITEAGSFYEVGSKFDVFYQVDKGFAVYTEHDHGLKNNGIALIPTNHCKVIQETEKKIELYIPQPKKIILL